MRQKGDFLLGIEPLPDAKEESETREKAAQQVARWGSLVACVMDVAWVECANTSEFIYHETQKALETQLNANVGDGAAAGVAPKEQKMRRASAFLLEHYSLVAHHRVCQLVVNTPEHYADLEAKRARKLKRKAEAERTPRIDRSVRMYKTSNLIMPRGGVGLSCIKRVAISAFVCAFVSAFVCSFRGLFARVSCMS